jgi:hypothetical protein
MVCSAHLALFPNCEITPKSGDAVELLSLLETGAIDAALLTLPANGIDLNVDQLSHERLVVCMRSNDPAASLDEIAPSSLEKKLKIFREPKQHPEGLLIANTNLRLNIPLILLETWDEGAIRDRGGLLADAALSVWPGPRP